MTRVIASLHHGRRPNGPNGRHRAVARVHGLKVLSLPMWPSITEEEQVRVVEALGRAL